MLQFWALVLVPIKRSKEEFDQGLLRACLPTNGWKVLFMDSDEAKAKELAEIVGVSDQGMASKIVDWVHTIPNISG